MSAAPVPPFTFLTLGRAELRATEDARSPIALQPKRLALLAFLAMTTRAPQSRDQIIALFWPEASQDEGRAALRQALHHLRQRVGEEAITSTADGRVVLDATFVRCDASDLEAAMQAGDDARALALYRGDFLDGLLPRDTSAEFEEWMDRTRRRLRVLAANAAQRVASAATRVGQFDAAVSAATRWTEIAPDDEDAVRTLLRLLEQQGRAGDALTTADRVAREFEQRLGVPLSAETLRLISDIRARRIVQADDVTAEATSPGATTRRTPSLQPAREARSSADSIQPVVPTNDRSRKPWVIVGVVAATAALMFAALRGWSDEPATTVADAAFPPDRIIVTDFRDNGNGLGATVAAALRVDLAQSPQVRVLTGAQVRDAAQLSGSSEGPSLSDSLIRTIAVREGIKAFVTGEVSRVGGNWLFTATLVNAGDGSALVSARETAEDSLQILAAIERLSRKLNTRVGKALALQPNVLPLERATTSSLAALRAYSDGIRLLDDGQREQGIALLEDAVRIDTAFATAWRMLGSTWSGLGEPAKSQLALTQAFTHRERLTFRERYLLEGSYYRNFARDQTKAVAAYRTLLAAYPNDVAGMNNLALVYVSLQQHAQAESLFRRVVAADSTLVNARLTLAEQIAMQRRHDDAAAVMNEAARRFPDHPTVRLTPIYLATAAQQWARAESLATARLNSGVSSIQRIDALQTLAQIEMVRGQVERAERHLSDAMQLALTEDSPYRYLSSAITSSWLALRYRGDVSEARATLQRALARVPLNTIDESDRPMAALIAVYIALGQQAQAMQLAGGVSAPRVMSVEREYAKGLLLLADGRASEAATILAREADAVHDCAMCPLPSLAYARATAGDTAGAIRAAEEYLEAPYIHRFEPDAVELPELLLRLAGWHDRRGEAARARTARQRLLDLWVDAEPNLNGQIADLRRRIAGPTGKN
ncbi:MAG: BTAD domain-containing putative transcriptional regulator [Gemmatimonas sp.]